MRFSAAAILLAFIRGTAAFTVGTASSRPCSNTQLRDANLVADAAVGGLQIPTDSLPAVIGAAVAALGGTLAATMTNTVMGKSIAKTVFEEQVKEEEVIKIDTSIPYDAAAQLAYAEFRGSEADFEAMEYAQFQKLWVGVQVAEATLKKKERDFAEFQKQTKKPE